LENVTFNQADMTEKLASHVTQINMK